MTVPNGIFQNCNNLKHVKFNADITTIGSYAFAECPNLGSASNGSVAIPTNCVEIDDYAFYKCSGLKVVLFNNKLNRIGKSAFAYCTSLSGLDFPEGYKELIIDDYAFYECSGIKTIIFNESEKIGLRKGTFDKLPNLERLHLVNGIDSLGTYNFNDCKYLKDFELKGAEAGKTPNLPSAIRYIGPNCFNRCNAITHVDLPAPGKDRFDIMDSFNSCRFLVSVTLDPNNLNYGFINSYTASAVKTVRPASTKSRSAKGTVLIDGWSFGLCSALEKFEFPYTIGEGGGLYSCRNFVFDELILPYTETVFRTAVPGYVKKAILKKTVRILQEGAIDNVDEIILSDSLRVMHSNCLKLNKATELTLPDSLSEIYPSAIECSTLKKLTVLNPVPPTAHGQIISGCKNITLYVPYGSAEAYKNSDGWKNFGTILELPGAGINNIGTDDNVCIKIMDGRLTVTGCTQISIFDLQGKEVYNGHPDNLNCIESGTYILRVNSKAIKVVL